MTQEDSLSTEMESRVQIVRLARSEVRVSKGWAMTGSEN